MEKRRVKQHTKKNLDLRQHKSWVYSSRIVPPEAEENICEYVLPYFIDEIMGCKRGLKCEIAISIIYNLVVRGRKGYCVSDVRDGQEPDIKLRVEMWDLILETGLARMCLGDESFGQLTRYFATRRLLNLLDNR